MKVPHHILRLYARTARRYKKLATKLRRTDTTSYQRKTFLHQLRKLLRKLRYLEGQLKLAMATGAVALMLQATPAKAQEDPAFYTVGPFSKVPRQDNPLREPIFTNRRPAMATVDLDGDGDLDIVIGEADYEDYNGGYLRYFENRSSEGNPIYVELEDEDNPFDGIRAGASGVAPAFADIDKDGDFDLFLGLNGYNYSGYSIEYYVNDGGKFTQQTGLWDPDTKQGNPFDTLELGSHVRPLFVDFDNDNDMDVMIGSTVYRQVYPYDEIYLHYYENDGEGIFEKKEITIDASDFAFQDWLYPAMADFDEDGDLDMVLGSYYAERLVYYKQVSPLVFEEEYGPWDPIEKTGNPFDHFVVVAHVSPVLLDFNNDGKLDVFVADDTDLYGYKYNDHIVDYYENTGDFVFEQRDEFDNPFGGVFVWDSAAPHFMDIDDDGDLDVLIGNKYERAYYDYNNEQWIYIESKIAVYKNDDGTYRRVVSEEYPFEPHDIRAEVSPDAADIDGDGDMDVITSDFWGEVHFFQNDKGYFYRDFETNPFAGIQHGYYSAARLLDVDGDELLDLVMANGNGDIEVFQNTGSAEMPEFSQTPMVANPMDTLSYHTWGTPFMRFVDIDHDGDLDVMFNGATPFYDEYAYVVAENISGPGKPPIYRNFVEGLFPDLDEEDQAYAQAYMIDFDGDGDLDVFFGNSNGSVSYFENRNVGVTTTVSDVPVEYVNGGNPIPIAPELTLSDEDEDLVIHATVTILDYQPGEVLAFTPQDGIIGSFDVETGVLTFSGRAPVSVYQDLLRSVTFEVEYESESDGMRQGKPKNTVIGKTISFEVRDIDFTQVDAITKSIEIFVNDPPAMNPGTIQLAIGGSATLDLKTLLSDPNGAQDIDLTSLKVINTPSSGASTSINGSGILTVDYDGLSFVGSETITVEGCDLGGLCAEAVITITVGNAPPVFEDEPVSTPAGVVKTVNLMNITTDPDGNLNHQGFSIVSQPASGAVASIQVVSPTVVNLVLDYEGLVFDGTDEVTVRACDLAGACTDHILGIEVNVDDAPTITVYNGVAPSSTGDNKFMRITGLPEVHKVTIFSRWGDKVFESTKYNNSGGGKVFRGMNDDGKALPSGTYYYVIEVPGEKDVTGYVTLKQ